MHVGSVGLVGQKGERGNDGTPGLRGFTGPQGPPGTYFELILTSMMNHGDSRHFRLEVGEARIVSISVYKHIVCRRCGACPLGKF